jgi:hypothetical protein
LHILLYHSLIKSVFFSSVSIPIGFSVMNCHTCPPHTRSFYFILEWNILLWTCNNKISPKKNSSSYVKNYMAFPLREILNSIFILFSIWNNFIMELKLKRLDENGTHNFGVILFKCVYRNVQTEVSICIGRDFILQTLLQRTHDLRRMKFYRSYRNMFWND